MMRHLFTAGIVVGLLTACSPTEQGAGIGAAIGQGQRQAVAHQPQARLVRLGFHLPSLAQPSWSPRCWPHWARPAT